MTQSLVVMRSVGILYPCTSCISVYGFEWNAADRYEEHPDCQMVQEQGNWLVMTAQVTAETENLLYTCWYDLQLNKQMRPVVKSDVVSALPYPRVWSASNLPCNLGHLYFACFILITLPSKPPPFYLTFSSCATLTLLLLLLHFSQPVLLLLAFVAWVVHEHIVRFIEIIYTKIPKSKNKQDAKCFCLLESW